MAATTASATAATPAAPKAASTVRGAGFALLARWCDRGLGLISTLILARLLVPDDFGLVAMAWLVVALGEALLDLGVGAQLIARRDADRDDWDSGWTLRLVQQAALATAIAVLAPLAAGWMNEPRLTTVLWLLAPCILLNGFANIGLVLLQRDLAFERELAVSLARKLTSFTVTITWASIDPGPWALVAGAWAGAVANVTASYLAHPYRPRPTLCRVRRLAGSSGWLAARSLLSFLQMQSDRLVVGGTHSAAALGLYQLGDELASLPGNEVLAPLSRALFPSYVRSANDAPALARKVQLTVGLATLISAPACIGLAMVARDAVDVLLGSRWAAATPIVQALALGGLLTGLGQAHFAAAQAFGRFRLLTLFTAAHCALHVGTIWTLAVTVPGASAIAAVAWGRGSVQLAAAIAAGVVLAVTLRAVRARDLVIATYRPLLAAAGMAACLHAAAPALAHLASVARLPLTVALGALAYGLLLAMLSFAMPCPDGERGAERWALARLGDIARRRRPARMRPGTPTPEPR